MATSVKMSSKFFKIRKFPKKKNFLGNYKNFLYLKVTFHNLKAKKFLVENSFKIQTD